MEQCAAALQNRLQQHPHQHLHRQQTLPAPIRDVLARAALDESRSALSGRAQLHRIATAAAKHGWPVIVLKGGVAIAEGGQVPVSDIDILTDESHHRAIDAWLAQFGDRASEAGPTAHHLAARLSEDAIPIEVHTTVANIDDIAAVRARAIPLRTMPALRRLSPSDDVWYTMLHATVQHPERRGRIRELLLLARGIAECHAIGTVAEIQAQIHAHAIREILEQTFSLANAISQTAVTGDPFATLSLRKYVFLRRYGTSTNTRERALRVVCSDQSWWEALRADLRLPLEAHSAWPLLNWLNRHAAWLTWPVRQGLRVGRILLVANLSAATRRESRRLLGRTSRG